ncbi:MAG TPA: hypothetical protein DCW90_19765 [Lachnospiraceae bacterium]|nr:hypothetical protein [Lachnospiraceae bacterium]
MCYEYDVALSFAGEDRKFVEDEEYLLPVKLDEQMHILNNWNEFAYWFEEVCADDYQYNDKYIEGFVFEDTTGFMCKTKTAYYKMWKLLRSVAKDTLTCGYFSKTGALQNITMNQFYGWVKNKFKTFDKNTNIITLRNMFETESRTS